MNKQIPIAMLCVLTTSFIHTEEVVTQAPLTEQAVETVSQTPQQSSSDAQTTPVKPRPRPKPDISKSFSRFLGYFYSLISQPSVAGHIKTVEKMFASLMHASYQAVQIAKPHLKPQKRSDCEHLVLDPEILDNIAQQLSVMLKEHAKVHKGRPRQGGMDPETKEIVKNVRELANSFFNILEDPENPKTVPENLKGLFGSFINIGTIAMMSKGAPPLDADYEDCKAYAQQLDEEVKESLYRVIVTSYEQSSISFK